MPHRRLTPHAARSPRCTHLHSHAPPRGPAAASLEQLVPLQLHSLAFSALLSCVWFRPVFVEDLQRAKATFDYWTGALSWSDELRRWQAMTISPRRTPTVLLSSAFALFFCVFWASELQERLRIDANTLGARVVWFAGSGCHLRVRVLEDLGFTGRRCNFKLIFFRNNTNILLIKIYFFNNLFLASRRPADSAYIGRFRQAAELGCPIFGFFFVHNFLNIS